MGERHRERVPGRAAGPCRAVREPKIPATLVTAMALTALTAVANVLLGSLVLTQSLVGTLPHTIDIPSPVVLAVALTHLVLGGVTALAAVGLSRRRHSRRVVLTVVVTLGMAMASVSVGLTGAWCSTCSLIAIAVSWVVITLLWDSRANEYYFRTARWQEMVGMARAGSAGRQAGDREVGVHAGS